MSKIYNLPNLLIQTNTEREYKLVSDETGSLHNVIVESKDQTTINIDLSNINFEGIEFQLNSDLGATTLEWIKNTTNIPFNTVEQRVITCADELKTTYREQLELLISKGYSIELPEQKITSLSLNLQSGSNPITGYEAPNNTATWWPVVEPEGVPYDIVWAVDGTEIPANSFIYKYGMSFWDMGICTCQNLNDTPQMNKDIVITATDTISGLSAEVVLQVRTEPEKYKLNITCDGTHSDWTNLINEPHTSFTRNLIGDDGEVYGDIYAEYDKRTEYVSVYVNTKLVDWYNKFTFVNMFVGLMDMMYNSTYKVYEGYNKMHLYVNIYGKDGLPDYQWTNTVMSISLMTNNVDWSDYNNYSQYFGTASTWHYTLYDQNGSIINENDVPFGSSAYFNSLSFYNYPTTINP